MQACAYVFSFLHARASGGCMHVCQGRQEPAHELACRLALPNLCCPFTGPFHHRRRCAHPAG